MDPVIKVSRCSVRGILFKDKTLVKAERLSANPELVGMTSLELLAQAVQVIH